MNIIPNNIHLFVFLVIFKRDICCKPRLTGSKMTPQIEMEITLSHIETWIQLWTSLNFDPSPKQNVHPNQVKFGWNRVKI